MYNEKDLNLNEIMLKKISLYLLVWFSFFWFIKNETFASSEDILATPGSQYTTNTTTVFPSQVETTPAPSWLWPIDTSYKDYVKSQMDPATWKLKEWVVLDDKNTFTQKQIANEAYKNSPDNIGSTAFKLDINKLSPSKNKWTEWPAMNINNLLKNIAYLLLIIIPSLAVLFIVVWGMKIILAWWDSSKVGQGKTIITFNIIAVVVSLLSYSIIQLTTWILWWI